MEIWWFLLGNLIFQFGQSGGVSYAPPRIWAFFLVPHVWSRFARHNKRLMNGPSRGTATSILGCIMLGGVAAVNNAESVQARPTTNPRKLCVFHCRFAAKSRIETNFSRLYLPNACTYSPKILQSPARFYELSNTKKRGRSEKVDLASRNTLNCWIHCLWPSRSPVDNKFHR